MLSCDSDRTELPQICGEPGAFGANHRQFDASAAHCRGRGTPSDSLSRQEADSARVGRVRLYNKPQWPHPHNGRQRWRDGSFDHAIGETETSQESSAASSKKDQRSNCDCPQPQAKVQKAQALSRSGQPVQGIQDRNVLQSRPPMPTCSRHGWESPGPGTLDATGGGQASLRQGR